jgi:hypothetical protein
MAETSVTAIHEDSGQAVSKMQLWFGRIISGLAVAFFVMDGAMKLAKPDVVVKATRDLGYPESQIVGIGLTLLVCTLIYVVPRTSVLGAILLTGYLGGAIASQVRVQAAAFNVVFAFTFACLVWIGLWLRSPRARRFLWP